METPRNSEKIRHVFRWIDTICAFQPPIQMFDGYVQENQFMQRALKLARLGMTRGDGGPFGAVIVRDGEILGEGWNRVLSSHDPTAHGEITAIRAACTRLGSHSLAGCEIYTTGEPCPMCLGAIHWARIGRIHYGFTVEDAAAIGFDDREFYRQLALPEAERAIPSASLLRDEALQLIWDYAALPGRVSY